jgi:hypothetical protein
MNGGNRSSRRHTSIWLGVQLEQAIHVDLVGCTVGASNTRRFGWVDSRSKQYTPNGCDIRLIHLTLFSYPFSLTPFLLTHNVSSHFLLTYNHTTFSQFRLPGDFTHQFSQHFINRSYFDHFFQNMSFFFRQILDVFHAL